ncbi:EAL domain-containing protein [Romboutsia maritimum]|uniref:EAL domain-containing protein n=1 Tax=Romboutsia maritimum TaxID=2020948 RepID=A0A371IWU3_9FIRM|nr:EAL domain-containing protein [Romboutsia maritimum]RDY24950.1 EAL domain-containing protein [Romboutsia maritimum]
MKTEKRVIILNESRLENNDLYKKLITYGYDIFECLNIDEILIGDIKRNIILINGKEDYKINILKNIKNNKLLSKIPIIVLIDIDEQKKIDKYIKLGIKDYIKKPCNTDEISFRIKNIIDYYDLVEKLYKKECNIAEYINNIQDKDNKFQTLIDNMPIAIWVKDKDLVYTDVNKTYFLFSEIKNENIIGKRDEELWNDELVQKFYKEDKIVIEAKETIEFEEVRKFNNEERVYKVNKSPLLNIDEEVIGLIGIYQDITEFKLIENDIKKNASTDFLTQIPNRRGLYKHLESKLKQKNENLTVMFMDIDEFKKINDVYGHKSGDDVLRVVSNKIQMFFTEDFISRISGDEFVIVLEDDIEKKEIENRVEKFLKEINFELSIGKRKCYISGSIGVVQTNTEDDIESILIKADLAMYKAKQRGKNTFAFYEKGMVEEVEINSNIERDLHDSIEKGEVYLFYQPQYTGDKKLIGFEALFRWKNEKYKSVSVIKVIEIMEKTKLINKMGRYIFEKACIFAKEINENRKEKLIVSVNISPIQIMRKNFVLEVKDILKKVGVDPKTLGIEITESIFLDNLEDSINTISQLKSLGMKILLDDFGTKYSSLNYLARLPISSIKIDKSFIDKLTNKGNYKVLIKLITEIAHSIELPVVAEGVESSSQLEQLNDMNVDAIQGYIFSKPLTEEDAKKLINQDI